MNINHPKTWLFIALLISIIASAILIIKHHNDVKTEEKEMQQRIDNHSEIKDTV